MGGFSSKPKQTTQDTAILQLKIQRDKLKQLEKKIAHTMQMEHEGAIKLSKSGNKNGALLLLKKKKYQEQLLEKIGNQQLQLEQLVKLKR